MDGLAFSSATTTMTTSFSINRLLFPSLSSRIRIRSRERSFSFTQKSKFSVFASTEEPKLNQWDQMELKFGRLIGEDPKLTLAKIMGRKVNPDASYLEIEKSFHKKKGKIAEVEVVPLDWSKEKKPSSSLDGLNLVRPVPKKGVKFEVDDKPVVPKIKKPSQPRGKAVDSTTKGRIPNVILRKPSMYNGDDVEDKPSKFRLKPNLSLKMRNGQSKEKFSDMTLLRKPEPMSVNTNLEKKEESPSGNVEAGVIGDSVGLKMIKEGEDGFGDFMLLKKPEVKGDFEEKQEQFGDVDAKVTDFVDGTCLDTEVEATATADATKSEVEESLELGDGLTLKNPELENSSIIGMQPLEQSSVGSTEEETAVSDPSDKNLACSTVNSSVEAALQGKPQRLDQSVKETSKSSREEKVVVDPDGYGNATELRDLPSISPLEDTDWNRAEDLLKKGQRAEVELISSSTRGFVASFGALIGFLPYRNLAAKWKFLAFESWLRQKGLDPSMYRKSLGVIGSNDAMTENYSLDARLDPEIDRKIEGEVYSDMKLDDLLRIYDQEKLKFLSSFVGQRIKVNVVMADRKSRKLIYSVRPKEKEEFVERKHSLMAKLRVGDVVKCCIKKITYFGIFVEVEGVPALIHQTEVSWDATLDPSSYFRLGQIVEAKVHQLDFAQERIFLSLKEITPDPLIEALESVVGDPDQLDGRLEAAEADTEWGDVESLIKELQQVKGIQSVSKGRFFLSPGLTPTFQVYMASMFENQYKLLARSGNKVQEVIVQASLGKEEMKSTILLCTNKAA